MPSDAKLAEKQKYIDKLLRLLDTTKDVLLICVDNVGSKTITNIRQKLRGRATILMGKNTLIRTAIRKNMAEYEHLKLDCLLPGFNGNVGMVFVHDGDIEHVRQVFREYVMPAAAIAGATAPADVKIPGGPTGLDPAQTTFFQALNIPTKIVKGSIELTAEVHLIHKGKRVQASEQALLAKLGLKPFEYGIQLRHVFQSGNLFAAAVLDITDEVLLGYLMEGVRSVAALSREVDVPTKASLPHAVSNAFKNIASLVADIDFDFKQVEDIKKFFKDPSAFAAAAAPAAAACGGAAPAAAAAAEPAEEEEADMEFDLF